MATTILATGKPTYRVYCRDAPNYNLTVDKGMAILAPIDETNELQHWYKDEKYSEVRDAAGHRSFSLINKATGQTIKNFYGHPAPVRLVTYNPYVQDQSVLWALGDDSGDGYKAMRGLTGPASAASHLEATALNDWSYKGAIIIAGVWIDGHNQQWKIEPYGR